MEGKEGGKKRREAKKGKEGRNQGKEGRKGTKDMSKVSHDYEIFLGLLQDIKSLNKISYNS